MILFPQVIDHVLLMLVDPVPFFPNKSLLQPVPSIALAKNTGCSGGPRLADLDGQQ